jgi:hypothetical protein
MPTPLIYDIPAGDTLVRPFSAADNIFASGAIQSGALGADVVNSVNIGSGQVVSGKIGEGAVSSGNIASGSIGSVHLADNAVQSGDIGANAVNSGNISSGVIGEHHLRSGFAVTIAQILVDNTWLTAEPISGGRCVAFNTSGQLIQAKADDDLRLPSVGVIDTNYTSGTVATFFHKGRMSTTFFNFSGYLGRRLFVGISGELTGDPPQVAGQRVQKMGVASTSSGIFLAPDTDIIKLS